jgi:hypothetical protein
MPAGTLEHARALHRMRVSRAALHAHVARNAAHSRDETGYRPSPPAAA